MNKNLKLAIAWSIILGVVGGLACIMPVFTAAIVLLFLLIAVLMWAIDTIFKS